MLEIPFFETFTNRTRIGETMITTNTFATVQNYDVRSVGDTEDFSFIVPHEFPSVNVGKIRQC